MKKIIFILLVSGVVGKAVLGICEPIVANASNVEAKLLTKL